MRKKRLRALMLLLLAVTMVVAAACGSSSPSTTDSGGGDSAAADGGNGTSGASSDSTVTVGLSVDVTTLDPHMASDLVTNGVLVNVYEGLLWRKPNSSEVVPQLAESYERIDDTTWEFKLRQGVTFHNGEEFNAEAVKFSLERSLDPEQKAPQRNFIAVIQEVEIVDPYTVRIITDGPVPTLPTRLTTLPAQILPPKYVQENGDEHLANNPVGTGPYKFVKWVKDDQLVLEANPDYWAGAPKVESVIFKPITETSARIAALQTGDADIVVNLPPDQAAALEGSEGFSIQPVPSVLVVYLGIDTIRDVPTATREVREAINLAIDRETLVKDLLRGYGRVSAGPLSEEVGDYHDALEPYPYDPEKAKQLLKDAGYEDLSLTIHGPAGRYAMDREILQAIAGYLQAVGIDLTLQTHEWGEYAKIGYGSQDPGALAMLGFGGYGTFLPELVLYPTFVSDQPLSTTADPRLDELLEAGQNELDPERRAELFAEAQQLIYDEYYRVALYQQYDIYGVRDRIKGWEARGDQFILFKDIATDMEVTVE